MRTLDRFKHSDLRFPVTFLLCLGLLISLYYSLPTALVENSVVRFFAVIPGGLLLDWLTPAYPVTTDHTRILSPLASLNVLKGCEGTEALLILYAGLFAALRPFRKTLWGLLLGTLLIFVLNQVRILVLYFIVIHDKSLFEPVHGFMAPILIIACTGVFFLLWLKWSTPSGSRP